MFTTGFASNAHSECVFLCVRSSASVCESTVWAPTIGYLCLFRKAGPQRPGSTVWLAVRSLLWRVLYGGFFFSFAWCFFFILPIKCGMQDSWRPFEVCCVCMCMSVRVHACVCMFVCLPSLLFRFHTQRSVCGDETTSQAGKMGPETRSVIFPCQFDSICVCRSDLRWKQGGCEHNRKLFLSVAKSSHPERNNTFSKCVWVPCESCKTSGSLFTVCQRCLLSGCD